MMNNPRPYHIRINIDETSQKVVSAFNCCRMITVLPKCTLTIFALIEFLACPPCNQFNRIWDDIPFIASKYKKMNMIRSNRIIQYHQSISLFCFIQPLKPSTSILGKFEQKFPFVAPVGDVPYLSGYIVSLCSRHKFNCLYCPFYPQKGRYRPISKGYFKGISFDIN